MTIDLSQYLPFPKSFPMNDRQNGGRYVTLMLDMVQELLGPRKPGVALVKILFGGARPHLIVSGDLKNVTVQLSCSSDKDWGAFVGEFSHESVHVLDPVIGNASYLEEGVAELFKMRVLSQLNETFLPNSEPQYLEAVDLVRAVGLDPFEFAKDVRAQLGSLTGFDADDLVRHFPTIAAELASRLSEPCRTTV